MKSSNNAVLITGGATGIGFALAKVFIESGNQVLICGRRKERLLEAQRKFPEIKILVCDVSKETDQENLFHYVKDKFPDINILINNAGIQRNISLLNGIEDLQNGEDEIKINLEAPIRLSMMFLPYLTQKKDSYLINVSSGLGFVPAVNMPIYSATKAGLHSFTKSLRQQLLNAKSDVKVIEIIPPAVESELNLEERRKRGAKFNTSAEEFVEAVMKELLEDKLEIGYGFTEFVMNASKKEIDERFQTMNSRM